MWFAPRSVPHDGTAPAAPLTTPFDFPCGREFYDSQCTQDPCFRPSCAPPSFQEYWWSTVGYYSPGICPVGYTVGCSRWDARQGPKMEETEQAMMCVPSGYTCDSDPSFASSATAIAPMIQIRWAASDLPNLETHHMSPGLPAWETPKPGQDSADLKDRQAPSYVTGGLSAESTTNTGRRITGGAGSIDLPGGGGSAGSSGETSNGAKVGLGVGIPLGVLLLVGLGGFLIFLHRKQRVGEAQGETSQPSVYMPSQPELAGQELAEIDGQEKKDLAGSNMASNPPSEVPGATRPPAARARELNTVRSELSGQTLLDEVEAVPMPIHELAAYPYAQGPPVQGQPYVSNEQYGPQPQQQGMQRMQQSASPRSYTAYTQHQ